MLGRCGKQAMGGAVHVRELSHVQKRRLAMVDLWNRQIRRCDSRQGSHGRSSGLGLRL